MPKNFVPVYRLYLGNSRWKFFTRWRRGAMSTGQFVREYDPMSGKIQDHYTYLDDGTWPQPSYNQINMMRPEEVVRDG